MLNIWVVKKKKIRKKIRKDLKVKVQPKNNKRKQMMKMMEVIIVHHAAVIAAVVDHVKNVIAIKLKKHQKVKHSVGVFI